MSIYMKKDVTLKRDMSIYMNRDMPIHKKIRTQRDICIHGKRNHAYMKREIISI